MRLLRSRLEFASQPPAHAAVRTVLSELLPSTVDIISLVSGFVKGYFEISFKKFEKFKVLRIL